MNTFRCVRDHAWRDYWTTQTEHCSINSGHRWSEKRKLSTLEEKNSHAIWWWAVRVQTLRTEPRGPKSSGIVWFQWYHIDPASVILIWAHLYVSYLGSGYWLMPVIIRIMRRFGPGLIWTPCICPWRLYSLPLYSFRTFYYCFLKYIWVPGMCPGPRWIDYPAPRSPANSFVMAGPIRHCLLRAWSVRLFSFLVVQRQSYYDQYASLFTEQYRCIHKMHNSSQLRGSFDNAIRSVL